MKRRGDGVDRCKRREETKINTRGGKAAVKEGSRARKVDRTSKDQTKYCTYQFCTTASLRIVVFLLVYCEWCSVV